MKKKLIFLSTIICSIMILVGVQFAYNEYQGKKFVQDWTKSISQKNHKDFTEKTDLTSLIISVSNGHKKFISDSLENNKNEDLYFTIKNSFLGVMYDTFSKDLFVIVDSYFKNEKASTIFFADAEILSFINNIDYSSIKVIKESSSLDKNYYKINFYQKKIESNFSLTVGLSNHDQKIEDFKDLNILLKEYAYKKEIAIQKKNDETRMNIQKISLITFFESKTFNYFKSFGASTVHEVKIKNTSKSKINSTTIRIFCEDDYQDKVVDKLVVINKEIEPDQEISFKTQDISPEFNYLMLNQGKSPKVEIFSISTPEQHYHFIDDFNWDL